MTHLQQIGVDKSLRGQGKERPWDTEHAAAAKVEIHAMSQGEAQVAVGGQILNKGGLLLLAETDTA
jgi:hypothetical protein